MVGKYVAVSYDVARMHNYNSGTNHSAEPFAIRRPELGKQVPCCHIHTTHRALSSDLCVPFPDILFAAF